MSTAYGLASLRSCDLTDIVRSRVFRVWASLKRYYRKGGSVTADVATRAASSMVLGPGITPAVKPELATTAADFERWERTNVRPVNEGRASFWRTAAKIPA